MDDSEATHTDRKLDEVILLLRGEQDAPGLMGRLSTVEKDLNGNGDMGIKNKVRIMWRAHMWVLCTLSGFAGYILHSVFVHL